LLRLLDGLTFDFRTIISAAAPLQALFDEHYLNSGGGGFAPGCIAMNNNQLVLRAGSRLVPITAKSKTTYRDCLIFRKGLQIFCRRVQCHIYPSLVTHDLIL
jgi:hypothetical protein